MSKNSIWSSLLTAWRATNALLGSLALGGVLGWLLELYQPATAPWGLLAGLILGLLVGTWQTIKGLE